MKKKETPEEEDQPIVLHLAQVKNLPLHAVYPSEPFGGQIASPCLQDHFFFEEFDLLIVSTALLGCILLLNEVWSCFIQSFFPNSLHLPSNSAPIGLCIVLVEIGFCM